MSNTTKDEEAIFNAAIELGAPEERAAYLRQACDGDASLLARVEALVQVHASECSILEQVASGLELTLEGSAGGESLGGTVDRYRLLETIGEGGMATVYMAEQERPLLRKVALKVIKLGMDTKQVVARFDAERQALAMMDHPNIAKVLDAGATEAGRPYFVMELVKGVSITEYCDKNALSTEERLTLFVQVCHAIQHAHQKGIIHRDIKPSNVMITLHDGKPVPKVIDFGIAKATNQRLTEKTLFTRYAQMIGTPAYMSPEQAEMSGLDVDTRTDIYSLGVLLYELLTGATPFDGERLRSAGYLELQRIIREEEPVKPSTRLSSLGNDLIDVARQRGTKPDVLRKTLRGDLDWIVVKAMEKDRTRRYETAHALAEDIERHMRNEPISAGSPGLIHRLRKFTKRHRSQMAAAVVVVAAVVGITLSLVAYSRSVKVRWAREEALPMVAKLVAQDDYLAAFVLARQVKKYIPEDPLVEDLWPKMSRSLSATTTPDGAEIYYRDSADMNGPWLHLGTSPVRSVEFPKGSYRWRIVKHGYETREFATDDGFEITLQRSTRKRDRVLVDSPLCGSYFVDRYETTNQQYKQFIDDGGYQEREYWKPAFMKDGRELSWEQAMLEFRDKTGQAGPATWERGTYPPGQGEYPVSGISWYEAAAYAQFARKSLPTVSHWYEAAPGMDGGLVIPYSNFGDGPAPVGSHPGVGRHGLYDTAGNVREWCWNATDESGSQRYILGGSWEDPEYMYSLHSTCSPFDRSPGNGLRCVELRDPQSLRTPLFQPLENRPARDVSRLSQMSDDEFHSYKRLYSYERTDLDATTELMDRELAHFTVEKATFNAAYNNEKVTAYLFLPKAGVKPYQVLVFFPSVNARRDTSSQDPWDLKVALEYAEYGRAVLYPVYKGTYERGGGQPAPGETPAALLNWRVQMYQDLARSIDYLESRSDIDLEKIAFVGLSWGAGIGPNLVALEDRIKFAVLINGGCFIWSDNRAPGTDSARFASHVKVPLLMVNGVDDTFFPYQASQKPLFDLLGTPREHKHHQLYPGGHGAPGFPGNDAKRFIIEWLDRYMGPVEKRESGSGDGE